MKVLPKAFLARMERELGEEYPAFLACYERPHVRGVRVNTLKCTLENLRASLPFAITPTDFSPLSYSIPEGACKVGSLAMHHAGAFYAQEPSASSAVTALAPRPGDKVLDLCAAPGGKSTQLAALLAGQGLLWSNEVVKSRANVLLSNLERIGARNAVVSSCHPEVLCAGLAGFFDRVLADAPCSGEGMFRRDEQAVEHWSEEHVAACAVRQLAIIESAAQALKQGGTLVYSTCTFSSAENEGVLMAFLQRHTDFTLADCALACGRPTLGGSARRLYPMDGGEGHFVAVLRRLSENRCRVGEYRAENGTHTREVNELYNNVFSLPTEASLEERSGRVLLLPQGLPDLRGLGVLRAGVLLAQATPTGRFEPAHAAFMASKPPELLGVAEFSAGAPQLAAFLLGEEIDVPAALKGWAGVAVNGVITGFGKSSGGRLKNRYPKGLRTLEKTRE